MLQGADATANTDALLRERSRSRVFRSLSERSSLLEMLSRARRTAPGPTSAGPHAESLTELATDLSPLERVGEGRLVDVVQLMILDS